MIRFNLRKLLGKLIDLSGRDWNMKDVAKGSGLDPSTLSRLIKHPKMSPSTAVIDKLCQFFFREFKTCPDYVKNQKYLGKEAVLMKEIISELVCVFPDDQEYLSDLPEVIRKDLDQSSIDAMWQIYDNAARTKAKLISSLPAEHLPVIEQVGGGLEAILDELLEKRLQESQHSKQERSPMKKTPSKNSKSQSRKKTKD